jgi:hypothetical protein
VVLRPLVHIQLKCEDIALKERGYTNTSQDEHSKVLLEKVTTNKVILEFNNVLNELLHSSELVVF